LADGSNSFVPFSPLLTGIYPCLAEIYNYVRTQPALRKRFFSAEKKIHIDLRLLGIAIKHFTMQITDCHKSRTDKTPDAIAHKL
jgi:hypothetical protein